jgi:hypothetical protein
MDNDKKWEILDELLRYFEGTWTAGAGSFFLRHGYIVIKDYPAAVVADPGVRLVGASIPFTPNIIWDQSTLLTLKGRELVRKLASAERIMAIKELSDLIDGDNIYEEKKNDNV